MGSASTQRRLWSDDRRTVVDIQFVAEPQQLVIGRIDERLWAAVAGEP
jgi:hypothetical protein